MIAEAVVHAGPPAPVRRIVIGLAVGFVLLFVGVPLAAVFAEAFRAGIGVYFASLVDPAALSALRLTLIVAVISVPLNVAFGVAAAWAIARFRFPGRAILIALIDLPLAVSPVIAGLVFVLLFGAHGYLGPWLAAHHLRSSSRCPASCSRRRSSRSPTSRAS